MLNKLLNSEFMRYGLMAAVLVATELAVFVFLNSVLGISYLIATPASTITSIILNWYGSQRFVFKNRRHSPRTEFMLVGVVSVVGIGLQTAVAAIIVEIVHWAPFLAKVIAIGVTFFWNFWSRRTYIFPREPASGK